MSTLVENVNKVVAANAAIKSALAAKGVDTSDYQRLSQAAEKIALITGLRVDEGGLYAEYEYIES